MQSLVENYRSLADETRLRLLILLRAGGEFCVCDLMGALDMPQSTVSRHLAQLKRQGWLKDRRRGVWMYYSLNRNLNPFLQAQLALLISRLADHPTCRDDRQRLEDFLAAKTGGGCRKSVS